MTGAAARPGTSDTTRGAFLVLAAAALFSTGGAALKSPTLTNWQVAGARGAIAAVAMLLMVPAARRAWSPRTLLVGCAYAATLMTFAFATRLTTAANAIFLQSTAPLWMLLLSPWLLRETIRRSDVIFMAVLAFGLSLFFVGREEAVATAPNPVLGNVLGAVSGLTWALAVSGLRWLAKEEKADGAAAGATVAGNVICFLACLPFAWGAWTAPGGAGTVHDWAALAFLGVVQVALAYVCLTRGIRRIPAFEASLLLLLEPVLNPVWAWLVHGERPGGWALTGGALILVATAAHTLAARR
ncbi:MAG: DMT family transporter [Planctomycetes bacterium]|nr:DMT family transporter [Planctomycetota bacterium]